MEAKMNLTKKEIEEIGSYFELLTVKANLWNKRNDYLRKVDQLYGEIEEQDSLITELVKDKRWHKRMRFHEERQQDYLPF
jgi:hypothetical protein